VWLRWIRYLSHLYYGFYGFVVNNFAGRTGYECGGVAQEGAPCLTTGDAIITQ
jgi:hypothetical protein